MNANLKRLTVIGAGVSGTALAILARELGAEVFVSEEKGAIPQETAERLKKAGIEWETGGHSGRAFEADALLLSSGIPPTAFCVTEAERRGVPVTGELDFTLPRIKGRIVGVTGSNGKSTVTSLAGHVLKKIGLNVAVGGNLGTASSLFAGGKAFDYVVLELSSFQLHWVHELKSAAAIVTNLAPDHIDWHGSYEAYAAAKAKLISLQGPEGWSIVQDRDSAALRVKNQDRTVVLSWDEKPRSQTAGHIFMGDGYAALRMDGEHPLFRYGDTALLGRHNMENIAMTLTMARLLERAVPDVRQALGDFRPLPHRCELAGKIDGVTYVDDSKGTNVAASVTALTSIEGRKAVILGGKGKGEDYGALAEAVVKEADAAVLLGAEKDRIEAALRKAGFANIRKVSGMEEAVAAARESARPGMVVLLSPACTSWDMYESYKKRGEHFNAIVRNLANRSEP